jgi:hypothetical protein
MNPNLNLNTFSWKSMQLDIERHVNHTRFGPKSFKDCRKMGNNAIFESVVNHNASRMAPPGAVMEAYMTLTQHLVEAPRFMHALDFKVLGGLSLSR